MVRISFLTCFFLICLRLVIGWHFFFEGVSKYDSLQHTGSVMVTNKPFTSAGYFNEAEGPLGPTIRGFIGDEDAKAKAKLTQSEPDKMPAALEREWDEYFTTFIAYYHLNDAEKNAAQQILEKDKGDYINWLNPKKDDAKKDDGKKSKDSKEPKKIKKKISVGAVVDYDADDNVPDRIDKYEAKIKEVRDFYEKRLTTFGNVDKTYPELRTLKTEAATMRADLMKDVDEHTKKLKDDLAKVVKPKLTVDFGKIDDPDIDKRVLDMVKVKDGNKEKPDASLMPEALEKQWDAYYAYLKQAGQEKLRNDPKRGDEILAEAKLRYVRYLLDFDPTGQARMDKNVADRLAAYQAAVQNQDKSAAAERSRLRQSFMDDIVNHTEDMKKELGGFTDDGYKGIAPVEMPKTVVLGHEFPATRIGWLDWATRWMVLIAGGCLLLGLFTRLACLSCISFLVIEYLSNPPFPWLPVSPKSEGNYTFINKNVIELVALLVLVTLPTGRWLGLDAILSRLWPFGRRSGGARR